MNLQLDSVLGYGLKQVVALLNCGFADYVVPIELDWASLHHMVRADGIDGSSQVVHRDGQAVGIALTTQPPNDLTI